jgi:hypothetical protein
LSFFKAFDLPHRLYTAYAKDLEIEQVNNETFRYRVRTPHAKGYSGAQTYLV